MSLTFSSDSLNIPQPSNGGGSSYVLPPATTTTLGGVKPDGTTITVQGDGTITAVGGTPVDAYTKSETDALLAKKEDSFTTIAPLKKANSTVNQLNGFTYASETTVNPDYTATSQTMTDFTTQASSPVIFAGESGREQLGSSYVILPFKSGNVYKFPSKDAKTISNVLYGYFNADGSFQTVIRVPSLGWIANNSSNNLTPKFTSGSSALASTNFNPSSDYPNVDRHAGYTQIEIRERTSEILVQSWGVLNTGSTYYGCTVTSSDPTIYANTQKVTHVVWIPTNAIAKPYNVNQFGIYENPQRVGWTINDLNNFLATAPNTLDLSSQGLNSILSLDIGNGLSIIGDKLVAVSPVNTLLKIDTTGLNTSVNNGSTQNLLDLISLTASGTNVITTANIDVSNYDLIGGILKLPYLPTVNPRYTNPYCDYTFDVRLTGTIGGGTNTAREFSIELQRGSNNSLVERKAIVKVNGTDLASRAVSFNTYTNTSTDPFISGGLKLIFNNTSGQTITITSITLLIKGRTN